MRVFKKIIFLITTFAAVLIIDFYALSEIPFGVKLPFGLKGSCYGYKETGFPFSVWDIAPPDTNCLNSFNVAGFVFNFILLSLLTSILIKFLKKKVRLTS